MRISKDLAEQIATALTEKSRQKKEHLKRAYRKLVYDAHIATIPEDIKKLYEKHHEYFYVSSSIYLDGHGFNREFVSVDKLVPENRVRKETPLDKETAKTLVAAKRAAEDATKQCEDLRQEICNTLLALRTFKKIIEHFPEAEKYLPRTPGAVCLAIIPDLTKLKAKLKAQ